MQEHLLALLDGHNVAAAAHYAIAHGYADSPLGRACRRTSSLSLRRVPAESLRGDFAFHPTHKIKIF